MEQRLHAEAKSIEDFYTKKLETLEAENIEILRRCEEQLTESEANYKKQLAKLHESYAAETEQMKNDHITAIENIRQSKLVEFAAVQENGSYLSTLRSASSQLESANENLSSLRVNINTNIERINVERETQLEIRERRIEGNNDTESLLNF